MPDNCSLLFKKEKKRIYDWKSKVKEQWNVREVFITKDLTPLRSKLLQYVKYECDYEFVLCHTINGKGNPKDKGVGEWIYFNSNDDLFKLNVDIDFGKPNFVLYCPC